MLTSIKEIMLDAIAEKADAQDIVEGILRLLKGRWLTREQVDQIIQELNRCLEVGNEQSTSTG